LINAAVPFDELETAVAEQARQLAAIPSSQLAAMKLIVNQAYENMGLRATQTLGPILDGLMRNTPAGLAFVGRLRPPASAPRPPAATVRSRTTAQRPPTTDPTRNTSSRLNTESG
jgi:hypothetical protein